MSSQIDPTLHQPKKPDWIKVRLPSNPAFFSTKALISDVRLHTVCESAQCPNRWECWSQGTATVMIAGERCTRACGFCAVSTAKPFALEPDEPDRVAEAVRRLGLKHVVVTSVTRDDLADGGAAHFAKTILALRDMLPSVAVEVLTPDFRGSAPSVRTVVEAHPDYFNHNVETVPRLYDFVRPGSRFERSIGVLAEARRLDEAVVTKSGFMLGLGERRQEVVTVMHALRDAGVEILTIGQYLQPKREK